MQKERRKRQVRRFVGAFFLVLFLVVSLATILFFTPIARGDQKGFVFVSEDSTLETVVLQADNELSLFSPSLVKLYAKLVALNSRLREGRFEVHSKMSYYSLFKRLLLEGQTPLMVSFSSVRLQKDLVDRLTKDLKMDAQALAKLLSDSTYCASLGFDTTTIRCIFIPDSHEVYWTITPQNLVAKFHASYTAFWTEKRLKKAEEAGLTPVEVSTLASIVEEESNKQDEYSRIAGLISTAFARRSLCKPILP